MLSLTKNPTKIATVPMVAVSSTPYLKIQDWAEDDRPREKLTNKGKEALTTAELIGILLGSGTKNLTAVALAQHILNHYDNDLSKLARLSVNELKKFKGVGQAKAVAIVSAMELSRRRHLSEVATRPKIESSRDIYKIIKPELSDKVVEEFWILLLTRTAHLIKKVLISVGGVAQLSVDPKVVFKTAFDHHAASIVLIHNHPSGNVKPSEADIQLTERLIEAGKLLDIPVVDHLIFGEKKYFSFLDEDVLL